MTNQASQSYVLMAAMYDKMLFSILDYMLAWKLILYTVSNLRTSEILQHYGCWHPYQVDVVMTENYLWCDYCQACPEMHYCVVLSDCLTISAQKSPYQRLHLNPNGSLFPLHSPSKELYPILLQSNPIQNLELYIAGPRGKLLLGIFLIRSADRLRGYRKMRWR